jgi:hypothetical protein
MRRIANVSWIWAWTPGYSPIVALGVGTSKTFIGARVVLVYLLVGFVGFTIMPKEDPRFAGVTVGGAPPRVE